MSTRNVISTGTYFNFDYFDAWDGTPLPRGQAEAPFAYAYDKVGNPAHSAQGYSRTVQTRTITNTQVTTYTYDVANRMTKVGTVNYTWDNNGNLTNDGSANYLHDRANRLISTTLGGVTTQFSYNGDGTRLRQVVAGTPTTYTQDLAAPLPVVLQSKTGATTTKYVYSLGTRPLAQNGGAWEYLLPDALGSVRQIADANGNVTLTKSYEPYGSVLNSSGSATSIFGYSGEQFDTTGLIYLRARYMQPRLGIFTSRDPWDGDDLRPGSMNGWNYTDGNPINGMDPSGECVTDPMSILPFLSPNHIVCIVLLRGESFGSIAKDFGIPSRYLELMDYNNRNNPLWTSDPTRPKDLINRNNRIYVPKDWLQKPPEPHRPPQPPPDSPWLIDGYVKGMAWEVEIAHMGKMSILDGKRCEATHAGEGAEALVDLKHRRTAGYTYQYIVYDDYGTNLSGGAAFSTYFGLASGVERWGFQKYTGFTVCNALPVSADAFNHTIVAGAGLHATLCGPGTLPPAGVKPTNSGDGIWTTSIGVQGALSLFSISAPVKILAWYEYRGERDATSDELLQATQHIEEYGPK